MRAMVLRAPRTPLGEELRPVPRPGRGELVLAVRACAVCRTDLHLVDGELPMARLPVVPGHEVVGTVLSAGEGVEGFAAGQRIGVPWLGATCGACRYCTEDRENLCDAPQFTGCTRDGGFATHIAVDARFALPLDSLAMDDVSVAPLLCAGLIGWRALRMAGDDARAIGLYGFGAAAHLIAQVARQQGRRVYAFTRVGDHEAQQHAIELGAAWAGDAQTAPPEELDADLADAARIDGASGWSIFRYITLPLLSPVIFYNLVLAVIGPDWLEARDDHGTRRLDDPNDFVRLEIVTALQRNDTELAKRLEGIATNPRFGALTWYWAPRLYQRNRAQFRAFVFDHIRQRGIPAVLVTHDERLAARCDRVLRLDAGAALTLFDGRGGEWHARVATMGRSEVQVTLERFEEHAVFRDLAERLPVLKNLLMRHAMS